MQLVADVKVREEVSSDTDVAALSRERWGVEEGVCECEFVSCGERR